MNYDRPSAGVYDETIPDTNGIIDYMKEEEIKKHKTIEEVEKYGWFRRDPSSVNIYRSEYYWNNIYDANLCRKMIFYAKNHSLPREIVSQEEANNNWSVIKNTTDMKRDSVFARRHKLPQRVRYIELDRHILFNERTKSAFLQKIGYDILVSFDDVIHNSIFPYLLRVKIGYFFCPYVKFMETPQKSYLIIDEEACPNDILKKFRTVSTLNDKEYGVSCSITGSKRGKGYIHFTTTLEQLFSEDNIIIPFNAEKKTYEKKQKCACHIFITAHYNYSNIFHDLPGEIDYEKNLISISSNFKNYYIKNCFTTNNPFVIEGEMYKPEGEDHKIRVDLSNSNSGDIILTSKIEVFVLENNTPIVDYQYIPSVLVNEEEKQAKDLLFPYIGLSVTPCDGSIKDTRIDIGDISCGGYKRPIKNGSKRVMIKHGITGTFLEDLQDGVVFSQYPDTFLIERSSNGDNDGGSSNLSEYNWAVLDTYPNYLCIEQDIDLFQTNMIHFDDPMDLVKLWYGRERFYLDYYTGRMTKSFLTYIPDPDISYDYKDYVNSRFYKDIRAYEWDKLMRIYYYHPELFIEYIERRYEEAKYQDNESASDDTLYTIHTRDHIMDTSFYNTNPDEVVKFKCPQHYVKYSSANGADHFVELFIDGKRTMITYQEVYSHDLYIFYDAPESLEEDVTITVCRWDKLNKFKTKIRFQGLDEQILFPGEVETNFIRHIPISDLMYVDLDNNEYIDPSDIQYEIGVGVTEAENPFTDRNIDPSLIDNSYFLTNDIEYYTMVNGERLLLDEDRKMIGMPNYMESGDRSEIENKEAMKTYYTTSKKLMDLNHLMISSDNEANIYKDIIITNTHNGKTGIIPNLEEKEIKMVGFTRFEEDPDPYRFRAYHNGKLIPMDCYRYEKPKHFQDNAYFYFDNFTEGEIILDYIPYHEKLVLDEMVSMEGTSKYTTYYESEYGSVIIVNTNADWFNGPICEFQIKVWIDGIRISPKKIHRTLDLTRFFIEVNPLENKGYPSRITIYLDRLIENMEGTTDEAKKRVILQTDQLREYNLTRGVIEDKFYQEEDIEKFYTGPNMEYVLEKFKRKWNLK